MNTSNLDWNKQNGLIPAVVQNNETQKVLMLGYMNPESLQKTIHTKKVWFWSRSKQRLWKKGESSGNILELIEIKIDCDQDSLLVLVKAKGPTCHTGKESCFDSEENSEKKDISILSSLYKLLEKRKEKMPEKSYTTSLFQKGLDSICVKVAEESGEVIKAAQKETQQRLVEESVDVLYHLFVLLIYKNISLDQILEEVEKRKK